MEFPCSNCKYAKERKVGCRSYLSCSDKEKEKGYNDSLKEFNIIKCSNRELR